MHPVAHQVDCAGGSQTPHRPGCDLSVTRRKRDHMQQDRAFLDPPHKSDDLDERATSALASSVTDNNLQDVSTLDQLKGPSKLTGITPGVVPVALAPAPNTPSTR